MKREIDSLQEILKNSVSNVSSPLYGKIKRVFWGDPIQILLEDTPCITIQPADTNYDRRGSRYDDKIRDILVTTVYNLNTYKGLKKGTAISLTNASWSANEITFTKTSHGLSAGDEILVAGVTPTGYNGTYSISSVVDDDNFKVVQTTDPGTYSSGGTVREITNDKVYAVYEGIDMVEKMNEERQTDNLSICGVIQNNPTLPYTEGGVTKYAAVDSKVERVSYRFKSDRGFLTWEILTYVKVHTIGDR